MKANNMNYVISGGVGDFLQCLPFMLNNKGAHINYIVASHFKGAETFFKRIGLQIHKYEFYSSNEEVQSILKSLSTLNHVSFCPRSQYFESNPFTFTTIKFSNNYKVIGLHLNGSKYAEEANLLNGLPSKNIPIKILEKIIEFKCNIILFGSPKERAAINFSESDSFRFSSSVEIAESLSSVRVCDLFIGCDSAFKSMSSMLRIPTLVWLPNYEDKFRDNIFINPYVKDGIMKKSSFMSSDHALVNQAINETVEFIKNNGLISK